MLRNYFKIAFRNLVKHRTISFINLFGLTLGFTCCLLITTFILNELSYDKFNKNADRIYRVTRTFYNGDKIQSLKLSTIAPAFGYYLPGDFPVIEKMTRILNNSIIPIRYQDKMFNEKNSAFADENLFDVFSLKTIRGNPKTALAEPYSVMLTEELGHKYFGNEDPMGKVLRFNSQIDCKVTGIFQPFPSNSHMHPQMLLSFATLKDTTICGDEVLRTSWSNNSFFTYLLLPEKYNASDMVSQFPAFLDRRMDHAQYGGKNPSDFTKLDLQKLTDIHLRSHTDYEAEPNGDISRIYIFSAIALFILLIACINYMNLSTARSALRSREIGIRKVIGAGKKELILQFLGESVLLCWTAMLLAVLFTFLAMPLLSKLSGQDLSIHTLLQGKIIAILVLMPFAIGILSGIYPAFFMSSFKPIKTLKGVFKADGAGISFRKALVVTQFAIGIILIITTAIVFQQLHYVQKKSLGFDRDRIVTMPYSPDVDKNYDAFRTALLQNAAFKSMTRSTRIPTGRLLDNMGASVSNGDSLVPIKTDLRYVGCDEDFISTFSIPLAAGRFLSRDYGTDTSSFVINESAVSVLGWKNPSEAVGKRFKYGMMDGHIIGVVKDFHFESMHQKIGPIVLAMMPGVRSSFNNLSIKVASDNIPAAMASMAGTWKKYFPETPYDYSFLDDRFDKLYEAEQRQGNLFTVFACVAIFIACLGLFGLSAFTISQRVKEIGIRKVLGAKVNGLVGLLSKDFLMLVLVAAMLAFPIAWYAMHSWLKDFAYRVDIQWWVFIIAGLLAAMIAFVTVSFQAIRAAVRNPVKSLRTE